jgi:molybdenum cofactor cytidylyltransferase
VVNPDWQQGQLSSIQAALRSLPPGLTDGILLCLVDQPLITEKLVAELVEKFYSAGKLILLPTYHGRRGHPVIFSSKLYQELLDAPLDLGARAVVWAHPVDVLEVPTNEEGVILNLNDPEALRRALGTP